MAESKARHCPSQPVWARPSHPKGPRDIAFRTREKAPSSTFCISRRDIYGHGQPPLGRSLLVINKGQFSAAMIPKIIFFKNILPCLLMQVVKTSLGFAVCFLFSNFLQNFDGLITKFELTGPYLAF